LAGAPRDGSAEATVLHAVLCFKLGKLGHAERVAREACKVASPDSPLGTTVAECILGIALYFRGELEDAAAAVDRARQLAAANGNTLAHIYALGYSALARLELGDTEAARSAAREARALASAPPTSEHFVGATALLANGRLDADGASLEHALELTRRGAAPIEIAAVQLALGELRRDPATLQQARA